MVLSHSVMLRATIGSPYLPDILQMARKAVLCGLGLRLGGSPWDSYSTSLDMNPPPLVILSRRECLMQPRAPIFVPL